jgi:cytochrome bd-type quinol oxidase subunit 2
VSRRRSAALWAVASALLAAGAAWTGLAAVIGANEEHGSSSTGTEGGLVLVAALLGVGAVACLARAWRAWRTRRSDDTAARKLAPPRAFAVVLTVICVGIALPLIRAGLAGSTDWAPAPMVLVIGAAFSVAAIISASTLYRPRR